MRHSLTALALGLAIPTLAAVSRPMVVSALGFEFALVPGATPKKPASGLIAYNRPSGPGRIQQMSSPMVHTFQPSRT